MSETKKTTIPDKGAMYMIVGHSGAGKSLATKELNNALYFYADTKKAFPFKKLHVNIYPYGAFRTKKAGKTINTIPEKAIEYVGMHDFKTQLIKKIKTYKAAKGKLPETIVFDAITNIYKMLNDYIKTTTKNVYGSHSADTATAVDEFMAWIQKSVISKGINVVFTAHTTINRESGEVEIATSGSKTFENVGG